MAPFTGQIEPLIFVQAERAVVTASGAQGFEVAACPVIGLTRPEAMAIRDKNRKRTALCQTRPDGSLLGRDGFTAAAVVK